MAEVRGQTEVLLYRHGSVNGTWDDLICEALIAERDADIALSPGFRWGASVMPGQDIAREDIFNATATSHPNAYRSEMTGETLALILEDVADNLYNPDPYSQQGGDMVRVGGMRYRIDVNRPQGSRITDMTLLRTGEAIEAGKTYVVSGWASVNEGTESPPIWDVVENHIRNQGTVTVPENTTIAVVAKEEGRMVTKLKGTRSGRRNVLKSAMATKLVAGPWTVDDIVALVEKPEAEATPRKRGPCKPRVRKDISK